MSNAATQSKRLAPGNAGIAIGRTLAESMSAEEISTSERRVSAVKRLTEYGFDARGSLLFSDARVENARATCTVNTKPLVYKRGIIKGFFERCAELSR